MKRSVRFLALFAGLLGASLAHARDLPSVDVSRGAPAAVPSRAVSVQDLARRAGGFATSFDEKRGVPTFLWAAKGQKAPAIAGVTPESAARHHLARFAEVYGLGSGALSTAEVVHVHDRGQGAVIVQLQQRLGGVEVYRSEIKIVMRQDLELVAISGNLRADATPQGKPGARAFKLVENEAAAKALGDLYGVAAPPSSIVATKRVHGGYHLFDLAPTPAMKAAKLGFVEPARVKKVFFPLPDRIVPAYFVELLAGPADQTTSDAYRYVIAADDGRVLYRHNLTESDSFNYRVWADPDGRPMDGPQANFTPHPTGVPDDTLPDYVPSTVIAMEGFNTNPDMAVDPWLAASAVQTLGNNVDAYADHNAPDGYSNNDLRATVTASKTFDRVYDTSMSPIVSQTQTMAAATHLFYVNNWLHDYFYDSGFDEAAGNAQANNFDRGGIGGDVLRAEAQDGANLSPSPRNNANMSTPADGASPRMQMYLWTDDIRSIVIPLLGPDPRPVGTAGFGPTTFNLTGEIALINDGVDPFTNGCEPPPWNDITGKIALIDRGTCGFNLKAAQAEAAGAVGVIIVNNTPNAAPPGMAAANPPIPVTIPVMSITYEDGVTIKAALASQVVTTTMDRVLGVELDGTIDNTIVAHEWGHYFHHRLTDCTSDQCRAQSEGWGDFVALHMALREGDDLTAVFPLAIYATRDGYYGIRRAPYTTDMTKNGFSFRHIANGEALPPHPIGSGGSTNAEVHNAGEIWTSMLFEGYVRLLQQAQDPNGPYSFDEARRRMADYIVGGLKAAPLDATYTETRDAILAAALALDPADALLLADGFAVRGAGSCAISAPRYSSDFIGVVESFDVKPRIDIVSAVLDDGVKSCDTDGVLDAEETGRVTVEVRNGSLAPMTGVTATITTAHPAASFPNGATVDVGDLGPFETKTVFFEVALDETITTFEHLDLDVSVSHPDACETTVAIVRMPFVNYDDVAAISATDDAESSHEAWTATGEQADEIWARLEVDLVNRAWHGYDAGTTTDTALESPDLQVSATDPLVISFQHKFQFETDGTTNYDGGVIEISDDGGQTWVDLDTLADPYNGVVTAGTTSALAGAPAFVGASAAWPAYDTATFDLGTTYAGETVRIRFRIATDGGVGDYGWEIDNLVFEGITNTPFGALVDDGSICQALPEARAGADQTVTSGDQVTLDATESTDPNNDPLTFTWTQTGGPQVDLEGATNAVAGFRAPDVDADTTLTFQVAVSDGVGAASDTVDVVVQPASGATTSSSSSGSGGSTPKADDPAADSGCGCTVAGDEAPTTQASFASLLGAALLLVRRRRRQGGRA